MAIEIVDLSIKNCEIAIYSGFSHWKWWCSIVFCMFTRGYPPSGGHFEEEIFGDCHFEPQDILNNFWSIFGIPWYTHGIPRIPVGQPRIPMGQPMTCNPWEMAIPLDLSWWRSHHPQAIWISPIFQNGSGAQSIEMSPYVRPCLMCITVDTLDANLFPIFVVK